MIPKSIPKDAGISGVAPLGAPLVAQTAFGHQKLVPSAPKVIPIIEKSTKHDTKDLPECETWPNSSLFRTWAGGLREALTITFVQDTSMIFLYFVISASADTNGFHGSIKSECSKFQKSSKKYCNRSRIMN